MTPTVLSKIARNISRHFLKSFCRGRSEPLKVQVYNTMSTHTVCHVETPKTKDFDIIYINVSQHAKSLYFLHETKANVYAFILVSCPLFHSGQTSEICKS